MVFSKQQCRGSVICYHNYKNFPSNEELRNVRMSNIPNIVGAIDCTHIKIKNPGGKYPALYINRKGYFSWNVQVGRYFCEQL